MLLTITYSTAPATDLGYLLHKNPDAAQSFDLSFGKAHVFYTEVSAERCTAALLLEVDPVGLVRGGTFIDQYVNDRPYASSSLLSVAISRVFGTALSGRSKSRPELAESAIDLQARISVVPCQGGETLVRRLFEPLGYRVSISGDALDNKFPEWGTSKYLDVELSANCRLKDLLSHIYVLIPVLDNDKHYWIGDDEVKKLLHHGETWLGAHPEKTLITRRYLKHQRGLVREALGHLLEEDIQHPDADQTAHDSEERQIESRVGLNEQRIGAVLAALKSCGARRVIDLGCGEAKLVRALLDDSSFKEVVGLDVSHRALEKAAERLHLDRMAPVQRERVRLIQGSLTYRDARMAGYDAATVVEVIEHLDPQRLVAFERVLFEFARPSAVVITTPNVEFNQRFESLLAGRLRHRDHRFEWTRAEFQNWASGVCQRHGYAVRFLPIGEEDQLLGPPTQMGIFTSSL